MPNLSVVDLRGLHMTRYVLDEKRPSVLCTPLPIRPELSGMKFCRAVMGTDI